MEISIFQYSNPGQFLWEAYQARKVQRPALSLAQFSKIVGFGSPNYARLVIDGKRKLTQENVHKVCRALRMTFEETEFFAALVSLNQANTGEELAFYRKKVRLLKKAAPKSAARIPLAKVFNEWFCPAVLVGTDRQPRDGAVERIEKLLPLGTEKIRSLLDHFVMIGLLREIGENYELNQSHQIFFDERSINLRQKQFLLSQIDASRRMLQKTYDKGSKFYSHTFTIGSADAEFYSERLRSLLSEFTARSDSFPPEEVMQLNIQLFKVGPDCC